MPPTRRDQILRELARRRDTLNPRQQAIIQELSNRGVLEADTPSVQDEFDPVATVQRSLKSAGFDPGIVKPGLDESAKAALAANREAVVQETRKVDAPFRKRDEAFLEAQQAVREFQEIEETPELAEFLKKAQPDIPGVRAAVSGFQQSVLSSAGAASRAFQDEEKARELDQITKKLAAVDADKGRLSKAISGATRSFTDLLTGGGGATAIPLFMLKATNAAIDEGRAAGLTGPELGRFALTQGAIEGTVTAAFQAVGAGGLESSLRAPVAQGIKQALKQLGKGLAAEQVEELSVELGQRINSFLSGVDAQALDANQLADAALDIALTTTLTLGLAQGPSVLQTAVSRPPQQAQAPTEAVTAPEAEVQQEAAPAPAEAAPVVSPETQVDETQTPQPTTDETQTVADPEAPDVTVTQEGEVEAPAIVEPSPVDESGVPTSPETETPAQAIQRTAGERSPEGTTSARKVDVAANREAMNNVLLEQKDVRTWEEAQATAQDQDIPAQAMKLARGIKAVPRALSDIETAGVVQRTVSVIAEHNDLSAKLDQASETEAKLIDAELSRLEQDHDELTQALSISGTEKGRALNAQKLTLNQKFELVSVLGRAKRAKGKDLSVTDRTRIKKLTDDIQRLEKRLESLRNKKPSKSETLNRTRNSQIEKLVFQKAEVQGRINRVIENLKPRTWTEIAVREPLSIMRAMKSSFDVSAVGRQAGLATLGNPLRAARNLGPMFRALRSERAQFEINERIKNDPNFEKARRAGLRITDTSLGASLDAKEENYRSRLADKMPGVRASDRAFSTFLNLMRMDGFNAMEASLARTGEATAAEAAIIADTVNNFTGFGGLADMKKSSKVLNTVFWSPSLQLARFQVLVTRPAEIITGRRKGGQKISPRVRRLVAKEYGKTLLGMTVLLGLAKLAGFEIEENPQSSDFLKMKAGNTRIDIGAGITQFLVLGTRLGTGETKSPTTGKIRPIRGEDLRFGQDDAADVFFRFTRSKFTPGLGLAIDMFSGQNVVGEKVDVSTPAGAGKVLLEGLIPLSATEVFESFKEQDVPGALALSAMTIFGVGVQNFAPKEKPKKRRKRRRRD